MNRNRVFLMAASLAGLGIFASPSVSQAQLELQLDLNQLSVAHTGPSFNTNFTGTLTFSEGANGTLAAIIIGGVTQSLAGSLKSVNGNIDFVSGVPTAGQIDVEAFDSGSSGSFETFSTSVRPNVGFITELQGIYSIRGLVFASTFTSSTFVGVDVQPFFNYGPAPGRFEKFDYKPSQNSADLDIWVVIPLPGSAGLVMAGVGLIAFRRHRA